MTDTQNAHTSDEPKALRRAFADVSVWIFDLDNTLYPPESALWPQVDQRITLFLGDMFGIDGLSARALQHASQRGRANQPVPAFPQSPGIILGTSATFFRPPHPLRFFQ